MSAIEIRTRGGDVTGVYAGDSNRLTYESQQPEIALYKGRSYRVLDADGIYTGRDFTLIHSGKLATFKGIATGYYVLVGFMEVG